MGPESVGRWSVRDTAAIFQILQFGLLVLAAAYGFYQAREAARRRKSDAAQAMLNSISTESLRTVRFTVLHVLPQDRGVLCLDKLDEAQKAAVRTLAVAYDKVALLMVLDLLPRDILFDFQGEEILAIWKLAKPVIDEMRAKHRYNYCRHLEWLATKWYEEAKRKHNPRRCRVCRVVGYRAASESG